VKIEQFMAVLLSLPPRSHAHTAVWEWAAVNVNGKWQNDSLTYLLINNKRAEPCDRLERYQDIMFTVFRLWYRTLGLVCAWNRAAGLVSLFLFCAFN